MSALPLGWEGIEIVEGEEWEARMSKAEELTEALAEQVAKEDGWGSEHTGWDGEPCKDWGEMEEFTRATYRRSAEAVIKVGVNTLGITREMVEAVHLTAKHHYPGMTPLADALTALLDVAEGKDG